MRIFGTKMIIRKGDDDSLAIYMKNGRTFTSGDKVLFTVRKRINSQNPVFQILVDSFITYTDDNGVAHPGAALINIRRTDTADLLCREYIYDIHVEWKDNIHQTLVGPSPFILEAGLES